MVMEKSNKIRQIKFIYVAVVSEGESTGQTDTLFPS